MKKFLISVVLISSVYSVSASTAYGDGSDGSLTVTGSTVVNSYTYLTGDEASGSAELSVNDASALSEGDEIMIIQMQNGSGNGVAGRYEFREVLSAKNGVLDLESSIENSYYSGRFADSTEQKGVATQVVRVPEYENLTVDGGEITASGWDGRKGGIVAFRVQNTLKFLNSGNVNASALGFRGGTCGDCGSQTNAIDGGRGEGTDGWQLGGGAEDYSSSVENNNGIGGGGDHTTSNNGGDPAAGGGYATSGENSIGDGGNSEGGSTIGQASLEKMFFGGGGGAGSDNDGNTPYPERSDGGGIVFISANTINDAEIYAEGKDGITGLNDNAYGGNSGGGAGGSIFLRSRTINVNNIEAKGGDRSIDDGDGEQGGAGGDGRIRIDYSTASGLSNVNPSPGYTGDAPDFCDERGPENECFIKDKKDISSQNIDILEPFKAFRSSEIFSSTFTPLTVQSHANISGTFRGSIKFSAKSIRLKNGASFRPENGRIVLNTID